MSFWNLIDLSKFPFYEELFHFFGQKWIYAMIGRKIVHILVNMEKTWESLTEVERLETILSMKHHIRYQTAKINELLEHDEIFEYEYKYTSFIDREVKIIFDLSNDIANKIDNIKFLSKKDSSMMDAFRMFVNKFNDFFKGPARRKTDRAALRILSNTLNNVLLESH